MITFKIQSPVLGAANLLPASGRMVVRQGGRTVLDQALSFRTESADGGEVLPFWADDPWYLKQLPEPQEHFFSQLGFPPNLRKQATEPLARLLTLDACRALLTDQWGRYLVSALYQPFLPYVVPLLEIGQDLFAAQPWLDQPLLSRLLKDREHRGAATELAVVAALTRSQLQFDREPVGRGESRPDFVIYRDAQRTFVEVKASQTSEADREAQDLGDALGTLMGELTSSGKTSRIIGRPIIGELLADPQKHQELRQRFEALYEDLDKCIQCVRASAFEAGSYAGADYFDVVVRDSDDDGPTVELALWDGITPAKEVYRLMRLVRDAAQQVPTHSRAIVVLDVGSFKRIDLLHRELQRAAMGDVGRMHTVVGVVVYAYERDPQRGTTRVALPLWMARSRPTSAEREIAEHLCRGKRAVL